MISCILGIIDATITDKIINQYMLEFIEAVDCIYHCIGDYFNLKLNEGYD